MPEILIVDDEFALADVLAAILQTNGYRVSTAANGREALERMTSSPPDLVLTDLMMPYVDGYQLCRAMREHQHLGRIPVVMMTATPGKLDFHDCELVALLRKPFDAEMLLGTVERALASSREGDRANPETRH